jgi:uncharacterized membrane protein
MVEFPAGTLLSTFSSKLERNEDVSQLHTYHMEQCPVCN